MDATAYAYDEEAVLFRALDRGIDDMEAGRLMEHEAACDEIRRRLDEHIAEARQRNR